MNRHLWESRYNMIPGPPERGLQARPPAPHSLRPAGYTTSGDVLLNKSFDEIIHPIDYQPAP